MTDNSVLIISINELGKNRCEKAAYPATPQTKLIFCQMMPCFTTIPTTLQQPSLHYSSSSFAHHVRLGGEFLCLQTLDCHPLDRQLSLPVVLNTVILLIENVSGHAKVCHLHCVRLIQPTDRKGKVIFLLQIIIIETEGCDVTSLNL